MMSQTPAVGSERRVFLDTEFTDLPWTGRSRLLWVGMVDDGGQQFTAVAADALAVPCSPFVQAQVLPLIDPAVPVLDGSEMATALAEFLHGATEVWAWFPTIADVGTFGFDATEAAEIWSAYADWDYQLVSSAAGPQASGWPTRCDDLHALAIETEVELPHNPRPHHPVHDARWGHQVYMAARYRGS
ncbi:hypothetical protein [Pilimelia columellifera]|uniref:Uncharacterized protein n=1 Tax=Pilimelia columellifera subsp. columellifera TaxID=706583 RepID=A0ABN3NHK6_9ACTN